MTNSARERMVVMIVCIIGLLMNFIACYPGYMTGDTIDQYGQSLSGVYNSWHPPIMAAWWRCLNLIYSGPQVMLGFQLACFWLGIYLLYGIVKNSKWWYVVVSLFAVAPFVQNYPGYIVKDSQMALTWLLSCVWMLRIAVVKRKWATWELVICTMLLIYGCWIRLNALPGFIPLCFVWAYTFFQAKGKKTRMIYAFTLLVITVLSQPLIQNVVLKSEKAYPEIKLYLHDLSGIFVTTGADVFPQELYQNPQFDTTYIREHYSITSFDPIWWNDDNVKIINGDEATINELLRKAWIKEITAHPGLYLKNRLEGFLYYLRIKNSGTHFYYCIDFIDENKYGLDVSRNGLHEIWIKWINLSGGLPWMRPWFWLLVNIVLLFIVKKVTRPAFKAMYTALVWSGILYVLPVVFLFQVDYELRYTYWNCIACSLAILILIAERLENKILKPS